jgi:hypothetical protein
MKFSDQLHASIQLRPLLMRPEQAALLLGSGEVVTDFALAGWLVPVISEPKLCFMLTDIWSIASSGWKPARNWRHRRALVLVADPGPKPLSETLRSQIKLVASSKRNPCCSAQVRQASLLAARSCWKNSGVPAGSGHCMTVTGWFCFRCGRSRAVWPDWKSGRSQALIPNQNPRRFRFKSPPTVLGPSSFAKPVAPAALCQSMVNRFSFLVAPLFLHPQPRSTSRYPGRWVTGGRSVSRRWPVYRQAIGQS